MADAVTSKTLLNDGQRLVLLLTNVSDGTGESGVVKVDVSSLLKRNGSAPTHVVIDSARWSISGFQWVSLAFDATSDDVALVLGSGQGKLCLKDIGGLPDPKSTGTTGDLLLTTGPAGSGIHGTYTIKLNLRML